MKCNGIEITLEDELGHALYCEWAHCSGVDEAYRLTSDFQARIGRFDLTPHFRWIVF